MDRHNSFGASLGIYWSTQGLLWTDDFREESIGWELPSVGLYVLECSSKGDELGQSAYWKIIFVFIIHLLFFLRESTNVADALGGER